MYNGRKQFAKAVVARPLQGRKTDTRFTCQRRVSRSRGEIGSQRRAQRAKRTGFLMADASHNVAKQARQTGAAAAPDSSSLARLLGMRTRLVCVQCPGPQVPLKKTFQRTWTADAVHKPKFWT